jgi:Spy/CpxP family protein refolding chaperone
MKSIRFRILIAALAVTLGSALAQSQTADTAPAPPPHEHGAWGGPMGHELGMYVKVLGITEDQQTQMKAVLQKEHATMKPLMQQMHQLDQQLKQYEEGTYDAAKVQALVAAQAQNLVQMRVNEARIHSELYQMLTTDQQSKLKEFEANRQARMQQHMQNEGAAPPEE